MTRLIAFVTRRVPEKTRVMFYYAPLFLTGLIGLSLDPSETARMHGRRSFAIFLLLLMSSVLISIIPGMIYVLFPLSERAVSWFQFGAQALVGPVYIIYSMVYMFMVWRAEDVGTVSAKPLDRLMDRLEDLIRSG